MKQRLLVGLGLSGAIGLLAYRRRMLTAGGVFGSMLIGTIVFGVGGLAASTVVVFFFVSSSVLSHWHTERKQRVAADKFSKSSTRDLFQTLANGGVGALALLAYGLSPRRPQWLLAAFVGAFATATADTWATEVGTLSRSQPRLLTSGRKVPPGTSGGMTPLGTAAAIAGACALSLTATAATGRDNDSACSASVQLLAASLCGGIAGTLVDSLLGATIQRINRCPHCGSETERDVHACGTRTVYARGIRWIDNDAVNLLSTAAGAALAATMFQFAPATRRERPVG